MAKLPVFSVGGYDKIQPAIDAGILTYPSYVFVDDENDPIHNKQFIFINRNLEIKPTTGDNPKQVVNVESFENVEQPNNETLYILNGLVYIYNGTEFKPVYEDVSGEMSDVEERLSAVEGKVDSLETFQNSIQWVEL